MTSEDLKSKKKRVFNIWHKNHIEDIHDIEIELNSLRDKTNAKIITFIGVSEKFKGLNLIYTISDGFEFKLLAGIFTEAFQLIHYVKNQFLNGDLSLSIIKTTENALLFSPISESIVFLSLLPNEKSLKVVEDWFIKRKARLHEIFMSK